jgi:hypothetical protein
MEDVNELNEQMAEKLQIGVYKEKAGWQFESNSKNVGLESKCHPMGDQGISPLLSPSTPSPTLTEA